MTNLAAPAFTEAVIETAPAPPGSRSFLSEPPDPSAQGLHDAATIGAAFAALGIAAFVCDGFGRVRAMTPMARTALAADRIRLAGGRLQGPHGGDSGEIGAAIAAVTIEAPEAIEPAGRTIVCIDGREPAALEIIDVRALPCAPSAFGFEPRAIVVLRGAEPGAAQLEPILCRAFGLTSAEAQVAVRLMSGEPRTAIAAERGASLATVRSQIKNIFAKLNVTRERELVSLLARITRH